ncbi:hypothetical protein OG453_37930 [Streptomyces sp. NBC_01381]|uniref:hypothetical protein n=1 Tax=Streptomyces sp. NBC_01381 TaxID=2903845 RepID=UPI00224D6257|nr:hypothetical protein [Streptomyces sp. NBC_01381]MCX4672377.1 hypothetical protein [Streptomyces sp. NBC_01381]
MAALLLALTVPAVGASSAGADTPSRVAGPPARSGNPASTVDHVANFYGAYIDVLHDTGRGSLANGLRHHYLTSGLSKSLARWEAAHHRDGVLRAKGVPTAWRVTYQDSGMGHCWTRVKLTWHDGQHRAHHSYLIVQSDIATMDISGIQTD